MVVDPYHRYSNEAERSNHEIYDDFKLKIIFGLKSFNKNVSASSVIKIGMMSGD